MKNLKRTEWLIIVFVCLIGSITSTALSQDMAVPANLQAALFKKIFAFNKTLLANGKIEVAVVGAGGGDVVAAFKEAGVDAKALNQPDGAAIVYVMPGASAPNQKGTFTISGVADYAESGKVSVAIGLEGGKPKIIVNLTQSKAEGQELSADLLKISKVVQ
jgi:hypothetical protein